MRYEKPEINETLINLEDIILLSTSEDEASSWGEGAIFGDIYGDAE